MEEEPNTAEDWQPFAAFIVEFQARHVADEIAERRTTVHYLEGDKGEVWSGLEGKELCRWILGHLSELVPDEFTATVMALGPEEHISDTAESNLEPSMIEEPLTTIPPGVGISSPLEAEEPDAVEIATEKEILIKQPLPDRSQIKIAVGQLRISQSPYTKVSFSAGQKNRPSAPAPGW